MGERRRQHSSGTDLGEILRGVEVALRRCEHTGVIRKWLWGRRVFSQMIQITNGSDHQVALWASRRSFGRPPLGTVPTGLVSTTYPKLSSKLRELSAAGRFEREPLSAGTSPRALANQP